MCPARQRVPTAVLLIIIRIDPQKYNNHADKQQADINPSSPEDTSRSRSIGPTRTQIAGQPYACGWLLHLLQFGGLPPIHTISSEGGHRPGQEHRHGRSQRSSAPLVPPHGELSSFHSATIDLAERTAHRLDEGDRRGRKGVLLRRDAQSEQPRPSACPAVQEDLCRGLAQLQQICRAQRRILTPQPRYYRTRP